MNFKEIVTLWNSFAKKKCNKDCLVTEQQVVRTQTEYGDLFTESILNYKDACENPNTDMWDFNLYNYSARGYLKFLPGAYDIDNHDKRKFRKTVDVEKDDTLEKARNYK